MRSCLKSAIFWAAFLFVASSILFALLGTGHTAEGFSGTISQDADAAARLGSYVQAGTGEAASYEDANVENELVENSAILGGEHPVTGLVSVVGGTSHYKTRKGDSLQALALQFGVSTSSLAAANAALGSVKTIKGGTLITIPAR